MGTDPSRFDKVERHPDYRSAPAQPVLPADASIGVAAVAWPLLLSLFGAVFVLIAITLLFAIRPPLWFSLLFIAGGLVVAVGGIGFARGLAGVPGTGVLAVRDAPIERLIAVIVKERTEITKSNNDSTTTSYYATLQTRDGKRVEYRVSRALVGKLVIDDIGIAYVKEQVFELGFTTLRWKSLVEFIRFDV
jgi:hypothetical protein